MRYWIPSRVTVKKLLKEPISEQFRLKLAGPCRPAAIRAPLESTRDRVAGPTCDGQTTTGFMLPSRHVGVPGSECSSRRQPGRRQSNRHTDVECGPTAFTGASPGNRMVRARTRLADGRYSRLPARGNSHGPAENGTGWTLPAMSSIRWIGATTLCGLGMRAASRSASGVVVAGATTCRPCHHRI